MHAALPTRSRRLPAAPGLSATLTHYAPGTRQAAHEHDFTQISFLLAGELEETLGRRAFDLGSGRIGCKPAGALHANRFGRHGAVIFAVAIGESAAHPAAAEPGWSHAPDTARVTQLVRLALETGERGTRADALWDLVALSGPPDSCTAGTPPVWLSRIREQIRDAPEPLSIGEAASAAGIDRTRLSRMFRAYYGVPPSVYRLRCMAAKAIAATLASGNSIADAAHEAGFADQSHLSRTVRTLVGIPLHRLRTLLA